MTENRHCTTWSATSSLGWLALLMTGALLAGCGNKAPIASGPQARVFAADVSGGAARCEVPAVTPVSGQTVTTTMQVGNDGGWCGLPVHQEGPAPFAAGLLTERPSHGNVLIHEVGDDTRIDFTPDRGFTGGDTFSVKLLPGDATVRVRVTVTPPGK